MLTSSVGLVLATSATGALTFSAGMGSCRTGSGAAASTLWAGTKGFGIGCEVEDVVPGPIARCGGPCPGVLAGG